MTRGARRRLRRPRARLIAEAVEGEAEVLQGGVVLERAGNVARAVGADAVALQLQLDLRPHRISACSVAETGHCVN